MRPAGLTIRTRLTLWFVTTLAVLLGIYAITVSVLMERRLSDQLDHQVNEDHREVEDNLELASDGAVHWRPPTGVVPRPDDSQLWIHVRDVRGLVIYAHAPRGAARQILDVPVDARGIVSLPFGSDHVRAYVGTHRIGDSTVQVLAGRSERPLREHIHSLLMMLLLGLPVAIAVASVGGHFIARRALAPVEAITEHARRINVDRLTEQLPVTGTDDELGRLAAAFNEAFARIARSVEELRSFTAHASHELRTPLAALRSVGEVCLSQGHDAAVRREVIASMLEEADRMTRLIEALLALARLEGGPRAIQRGAVDLGALAQETAALVGVLAEERGQELTVEATSPLLVRADPTLLRQAILNLLDNAIKYGNEGGRIVVRTRTHDQSALLEVSDDGPGIEPEHRARLFERFHRASNAVAGFGLGLALARAAVEAQQGTLELTRTSPRGSTFTLRLPLRAS